MVPVRGRRTVAISSAIGLGIAAVAVAVIGVPRSEPEAWESAWVTSLSSRTLMVRALGQDGIAGGCGPPQVRLTVSESATQVRVAARAVRFHGIGGASCADEGYGRTSHAVSLKSPLGDRPVVDATTGSEKAVLDAATAATIDGLPSSLVTTDLAMETHDDGVPTLRRTWRSARDGQFVILQIATKSGSASRLSAE